MIFKDLEIGEKFEYHNYGLYFIKTEVWSRKGREFRTEEINSINLENGSGYWFDDDDQIFEISRYKDNDE